MFNIRFTPLSCINWRVPWGDIYSESELAWGLAFSTCLLSLVSCLCPGCLQISPVLRQVFSGPSLPNSSGRWAGWELCIEFSWWIHTYSNLWGGGQILICGAHLKFWLECISCCVGRANTQMWKSFSLGFDLPLMIPFKYKVQVLSLHN